MSSFAGLAQANQLIVNASGAESRHQFLERVRLRLRDAPLTNSALLVLGSCPKLEDCLFILEALAARLVCTRGAEIAVVVHDDTPQQAFGWNLLECVRAAEQLVGVSVRLLFGSPRHLEHDA